MLNPSIGKLIRVYESRYQLVIDVAKNARVISEKAEMEQMVLIEKPVNLALNRLCDLKCK